MYVLRAGRGDGTTWNYLWLGKERPSLITAHGLLTTLYHHSGLSTLVSLESESDSHLVVSDSLRPHGLYSPWNSPGQNTGVAFPFSRGSSQARDRTQVSCIAGEFFTSWSIREALMAIYLFKGPLLTLYVPWTSLTSPDALRLLLRADLQRVQFPDFSNDFLGSYPAWMHLSGIPIKEWVLISNKEQLILNPFIPNITRWGAGAFLFFEQFHIYPETGL